MRWLLISSALVVGCGAGSTDTGVAACPANPAFNCSVPVDCVQARCGDLVSFFNADGCMRVQCTRHDECADGELCYVADEYDSCLSGYWSCFEEDGTCMCGGSAGCEGAACVAADLHPLGGAAQPGPTAPGYGANACDPSDAPAIRFEFGVQASACGSPPAGDPVVTFVLISPTMTGNLPWTRWLGATRGFATYDSDGDGTAETTGDVGRFRITEWGPQGVVGNYEVAFDDGTVLFGDFGPVPFCDAPVQCG